MSPPSSSLTRRRLLQDSACIFAANGILAALGAFAAEMPSRVDAPQAEEAP